METAKKHYFQIRHISPALRQAVKVCAALEGRTMESFIVHTLANRVKAMGISFEEETNGKEEDTGTE